MPSIHKDVVNAFFKVAEVLFCSDNGYTKTATPYISDLLTMFTPGHWDHNIDIEHTFPAIYCFKTVESRQTGRIRLFQSTQIALPDILWAKWFVQIETKDTWAKPFESQEWVEAPVGINCTVSVMINLIFFYVNCSRNIHQILTPETSETSDNTRDKWNCLEPVLTKKVQINSKILKIWFIVHILIHLKQVSFFKKPWIIISKLNSLLTLKWGFDNTSLTNVWVRYILFYRSHLSYSQY